jgi:outer membrane immunogenic protein
MKRPPEAITAAKPKVLLGRQYVEVVMTRVILAATAAGLTALSGAAGAADLPRGPAPYYSAPAPMLYNWAGAYAGLNFGYQSGKITSSNAEPSGFVGGGQFGYNWQRGAFVFGAEADIQLTSADDTFAPYKFSNPWFGTVRGRIGYAMNNILFYATGGLAIGDITGEAGGLSETKTETGWTVGAGMEVGFAPAWSAKVEYLYMDLGSRAFLATGNENGFENNVLRIGVNYHF